MGLGLHKLQMSLPEAGTDLIFLGLSVVQSLRLVLRPVVKTGEGVGWT